jgi:hypothetical protein
VLVKEGLDTAWWFGGPAVVLAAIAALAATARSVRCWCGPIRQSGWCSVPG